MKLLQWVVGYIIAGEVALAFMAMLAALVFSGVVVNGQFHENYWLAAGLSLGIFNVIGAALAVIAFVGYLVVKIFKSIAKRGSLLLVS